MDNSIGSRLKRAWNVFLNRDPTYYRRDFGTSYSIRPDRPRLTRGNERSIVTSVCNRIALDVAAMDIRHCQLDDNGRFLKFVESGLDNCLTLEANIDQSGRAFIQDAVMSMMDEGAVALVPVDTDINPDDGSFNIETMRTGRIIEWYPAHVKVRLYNDRTGLKQDVIVSKKVVGIVENPLFAVMNEPNSTLQRLKRKLSLLDVTDENTASGKLDMIIQLPYAVKSQMQRERANSRLKSVEDQLAHGRYGIAYIDATEKVIQLNRPIENNLLKQIEFLTNTFFSQLGITQSVLDGTADEKTMLNYYNRSIEPIIATLVDEMKRKFLSKTSRTQGKTIMAFRDPFKLVPVNDIAEIADKFTRNEIMSSNEIRQKIGMPPSSDPKADRLENSNIRKPDQSTETVLPEKTDTANKDEEGG